MNEGRPETSFAKDRDSFIEFRQLIDGELFFRFVIRGGQMRHQSIDANVLKTSYCVAEFSNFAGAHTQASHAGIDLHMDISDRIRCMGLAIERFDHVEAINDRRQPMLQKRAFLTRPKTAETENRPCNPVASQLNSLFRQRDTEPIAAFAFQTMGTLNRAVPVSIGFDGRENLHVAADVFSDESVVVRERAEIDFGPGWTTGCEGRVIHRLRRLHRFKWKCSWSVDRTMHQFPLLICVICVICG